jgi:hypothetical protein
MSRNRIGLGGLNLTPLMDVFTTLVFFLVVNQSTTEVLETPKQITLPDSVVEEKPRETVVIFVSPEEITVQGEPVARVADILAGNSEDVAGVGLRLAWGGGKSSLLAGRVASVPAMSACNCSGVRAAA